MSEKSSVALPDLYLRLTGNDREGDDLKRLKRGILDNISLILNSRSHPRRQELRSNPELYYSVLGMGLGDFCGVSHNQSRIRELREEIREQLIHFEPRLNPESIEVRFVNDERVANGAIDLEISGQIQVAPFTDEVSVMFRLDLETGIPLRLTADDREE